MTSATNVEVANIAMVSIGGKPFASFDVGTTESNVASTLYELYVQSELASGRWNFAKNQAALNKLVAAPTEGYDYAYQLPTDLLTLTSVTFSDQPIKFERIGNLIYTNQNNSNDDVVATYTWRRAEIDWPPHFEQFIVDGLSHKFAVALGLEKWIVDSLAVGADTKKRDTRREDSQGQTAQRMRPGRLTGRRH